MIPSRRRNSKMSSRKTCCGCVSLQIASISIGVLDIVISIIGAFNKQLYLGIFTAFCAVLLIIGAVKQNHRWIWLWAVVHTAAVIIPASVFIYVLFFASYFGSDLTSNYSNLFWIWIMNTALLPVFGFCVYRVYIVSRYIRELLAESKRQQTPNGSITIE